MQQNQRRSNLIDRVRKHTERRALEQAKQVPWKHLAEAAEQYTEWQVFALWLRAVVEVAGSIPAVAEEELESRTPQFLVTARRNVEEALKAGESAGARIWEDAILWADMNVFVRPNRAGWLDAVRYFSSMSLRSIKAWSHWEDIDKEWRATTPQHLPDYAQWRCEVAAVARLSNPVSTAQQVLDSVRAVSEAEWSKLLHGFSDLMAFSLWVELVLDIEGPDSWLVSNELANRYPGFGVSGAIGSTAVVRALIEWAIEHALAIADQNRMLAALSFHVRHHPAYPAMRYYARHCHAVWCDEHPCHMPSFDEWREAADGYFQA